jgi:hypothetical protein
MSDTSHLYALDPDTFREWLTEQPETNIVGIACQDTKCPLANFLQSLYGGSWMVNHSGCEWLDHGMLYDIETLSPLPPWADCFVWLVDQLTDFFESSVSALEALILLDRALQQGEEVAHG